MKTRSSLRSKPSHQYNKSLKAGMFLALIILLLLSTSTAVANNAPEQRAGKEPADGKTASTVIIGVAAYLSGAGVIGWSQANSVQLAVNQVNAAGGIDIGGTAYDVALVAVDDTCNPTGAVAAANTLLVAGAVAVVGHSCSSASSAAQPLYYAEGVSMITPSASSPHLTLQGFNTTFRTITQDGSPAALLASYLHDWLGASSAAIVEVNWWAVPGNYFATEFTALGGTITSRRQVADPSGFNAALTAIKLENPDAIVNFFTDPSPGTPAGQFSDIAYDLGMTEVIIGWNSDTPDVSVLSDYAAAAGADAAAGDVVVMKLRNLQDMPGWEDFLAEYQAAGFANEPNDPGLFGPYAYDAAMIILQAIDRADSVVPSDIRDEIALTQNHAGVVGVYEGFDINGDVIPQWSWFVRYKQGQWLRQFPGQIFLPVLFRRTVP